MEEGIAYDFLVTATILPKQTFPSFLINNTEIFVQRSIQQKNKGIRVDDDNVC